MARETVLGFTTRCGAERAQGADDMPNRKPDLLVYADGPVCTVYLLHAASRAGAGWIAEHIPHDAQWLGTGVAVEHRYIGDIVAGALADGLRVR